MIQSQDSVNLHREMRDEKALDFQRFSPSNQLLVAVPWLMQIEGSFLLVQFYPRDKGTDNWQGPMSCFLSSNTKECLDCVGNAVLELESKSVIMTVLHDLLPNFHNTFFVCQGFLLEWSTVTRQHLSQPKTGAWGRKLLEPGIVMDFETLQYNITCLLLHTRFFCANWNLLGHFPIKRGVIFPHREKSYVCSHDSEDVRQR